MVGHASDRRCLPLQGFATRGLCGPTMSVRVTLTGLVRLSELHSGRRSGSLVRRSLLVVSTTSRSSAVRPARTRRSAPLPQAWMPSQGLRHGAVPFPMVQVREFRLRPAPEGARVRPAPKTAPCPGSEDPFRWCDPAGVPFPPRPEGLGFRFHPARPTRWSGPERPDRRADPGGSVPPSPPRRACSASRSRWVRFAGPIPKDPSRVPAPWVRIARLLPKDSPVAPFPVGPGRRADPEGSAPCPGPGGPFPWTPPSPPIRRTRPEGLARWTDREEHDRCARPEGRARWPSPRDSSASPVPKDGSLGRAPQELPVGPIPKDLSGGFGVPLLGFVRPFNAHGSRIRFTRVCLTRHVPPSGFLTPSTVCSPATLRPRGPLSFLGFSAARSPYAVGQLVDMLQITTARRTGPGTRCSSSPSSEEQEVKCSASVDPSRRPPGSPTAEAAASRRVCGPARTVPGLLEAARAEALGAAPPSASRCTAASRDVPIRPLGSDLFEVRRGSPRRVFRSRCLASRGAPGAS